MNPRLARISVFPIKSLDAHEPERATITSASPKGDRRYAITNESGEYVNGKRTAAVHRIRAGYEGYRVTPSEHTGDDRRDFSLEDDHEELTNWFNEYFGYPVRFIQKRKETLPEWTDSARFDHPFWLMVNTRVSEGGKIAVGDPVEILGKREEKMG